MNKVCIAYLPRTRVGGWDENFNTRDDPLGIEAKSQEKLFVNKTECSVCTPQASKKKTYFLQVKRKKLKAPYPYSLSRTQLRAFQNTS